MIRDGGCCCFGRRWFCGSFSCWLFGKGWDRKVAGIGGGLKGRPRKVLILGVVVVILLFVVILSFLVVVVVVVVVILILLI